MKKLILMRHAKSDWSEPGQRDKDRCLNKRGRAAAAQMGNWLRESGHIPDAAMVSSAARTRETWALMAMTCEAQFLDTLYLAECEEYLSAIQTASDVDCLLILGHNPGIEMAMGEMADGKPITAPTAATAIYTLPIKHWRDATFSLGSLIAYETPKSL